MNDRHEILTEEMAWTPCRASHLRRACWKKRGRLTHFSEPWEQCFDTKQHESLQCKRLVQCLFSSVQQCPTSHVASTWYNVRHHTDSYYMFLVNVQSRNYYEILWITNTMNCYDLLISLFFDCMFFLEICRFRGLFIAACCRMLSFWSPLSPLPLGASRVEDHRSEEKKHSTYVQIISVNLVKYSKVM